MLIGPNHGISAAIARLRKLDPGGTRPNRDPDDLSTWGAWDKLERTLLILAEDHDRAVIPGPNPPDPEPEPEPEPTLGYAPRAYNTAPNGADARFCMDSKWGVRRVQSGDNAPDGAVFIDRHSVFYDGGGRDLGQRTKMTVPELLFADNMDDRAVCDVYRGPTGRWIGGEHGYPAASFLR